MIENIQNKTALDSSLNFEVYNSIIQHCKANGKDIKIKPFSRTPFHTVLLHNSREDLVNKLLNKNLVTPSNKDIKTFQERPNKMSSFHSRPQKKKCSPSSFNVLSCLKFSYSKVGPKDFRGLMQLGKGSFGEVYLAEMLSTKEMFAIKVLRKEKVLSNNLVRYAFTERNIMMNITHPFIVKLHHSFQTPEKLVFVMEYCPGGDLGTHIAKEKSFSEEKAKFYLAEVVLALEELHKHGIIFRDLKPDNVVLDADGHAKLTDFGLSKEGAIEGQLTKSFCGSVAYLSPEMLRRTGHSKAVD